MTAADRRAIAADLRDAARIVADDLAMPHTLYTLWFPQGYGACSAIYSDNALDAFAAVYGKIGMCTGGRATRRIVVCA